jgi:hypothetical protein
MRAGAHPEHFWSAVDHALALLCAGYPVSTIRILAAGAIKRGLVDAAAGYDHAALIFAVVNAGRC